MSDFPGLLADWQPRLGEQRVAWLRQFREVFVVEWGSGSINGFAAEQASRIRED